MPLIVHNQPGARGSGSSAGGGKGSGRKPGKGNGKGGAPADYEVLKLVGLIAVAVLALGAVGWWFLAGRNSKPLITVPDRPVAPAGRPRLPATAQPRTGGAFGSNLGGSSGGVPRRGLDVPPDAGTPVEGGSSNPSGMAQPGGGAPPPASAGPYGRETGPE